MRRSAGLNITGHISITKAAGALSSVTVGGTVETLSANATVLESGTVGAVFSTHNSRPTLADLGKSLAGGQGGPVNLSSGGTLSITVNGTAFKVGIGATDRDTDDVITKLTARPRSAHP